MPSSTPLRYIPHRLSIAGGQHVIHATAQRSFFWAKLYVKGGRDLYCNVRFIVGQRVTVEHVYAAGLDCGSFWVPGSSLLAPGLQTG